MSNCVLKNMHFFIWTFEIYNSSQENYPTISIIPDLQFSSPFFFHVVVVVVVVSLANEAFTWFWKLLCNGLSFLVC